MKSALVIYIGVGNGFRSPAISIGKELEKKKIKVTYNDFYYDLKIKSYDTFIKKGWQLMQKIPFLFHFVLALSNSNFFKKSSNALFLFLFGYRKIKKHLKNINPDFIFITDFFSIHAYLKVIKKEKLNIPVFYYNSDVVFCHKMFINHDVTQAFVSTKEGYKDMLQKGVKKKLLTLTSFPIDKKYKKKFSSIAVERKKLGLENKFTILFSAGGEGIANLNWIESVLQQNLDVQIITICGKSQATLEKMKVIQKKYPKKNVIAKGFIDNMQDYLYCCDINSGKSGMNIIFESIFMQRPFLSLMSMANELHVESYMIKKNIGWRTRSTTKITSLIKSFLQDKNLIQEKSNNMKEMKIDFNTQKIAEDILDRK